MLSLAFHNSTSESEKWRQQTEIVTFRRHRQKRRSKVPPKTDFYCRDILQQTEKMLNTPLGV